MKKVFALNFTLYNKTVAEKESQAFASSGSVAEDCWVGNQRLPAMTNKPSTQQAQVAETH
ncbi:MAG: hypothetical protein HOO98_09350, partial [Nitrospira sp.]|nr:hypothetical protein [Nitrospira sp.]